LWIIQVPLTSVLLVNNFIVCLPSAFACVLRKNSDNSLRSFHLWYDKTYLLTAIRFKSCGSSTVHIYTQSIHITTQLTDLVGRLSGTRTQSGQTNWEECWPCPVFMSYTLAFALQLKKKHEKTSVRVAEQCQLARWKQNIQNRAYITIRIHKHNNKNT